MAAPRLCGLVPPLICVTLGLSSASAAPTLGFREDWNNPPSTSTWGGGADYSNPGTGGLGGIADGYLEVSRTLVGNLGAMSMGSEYTGDWTASGITQIRMWLKDVGADDPLEIHVSVGNGSNLWQYTPGFSPPTDSWAEYVADLTTPAAWTQIIGAGTGQTFAQALQFASRVLVRHDLAPYGQAPDPILGDFGLDHVLLTNGVVGVGDGAAPVARPIELGPPFPNPSRGPVALSISSSNPEPVRIEILDAHGRRVRSLSLPAWGAGPRLWMWDGRDDRGGRVPPGAYRVRVMGASGGMSRPLVRID